jgi:hypothetical protein
MTVLRRCFKVSVSLTAATLFYLTTLLVAYGQQIQPAATVVPVKTVVKEPVTGSITGEVLDENGRPMMNASILVGGMSGERATKTEATDETGKFVVRNLPQGLYRLQIRVPAYVQAEENLVTPDGSPRVYRTGETVNISLEKGGVITGTVTDQSGTAVVGVNVVAIRIRQPNEPSPLSDSTSGTSRFTDDRGIYRIYGLRPGRYFVYTGAGSSFGRPGPYDHDAPTYYPSSNRDTASTVNVQTGQEATGIDIKYRGERGFTVSGTIIGPTEKFVLLSLMLPGNPTPVGSAFSQERDGRNSFAFSSLISGEYKINAYTTDEKTGRASSGSVTVSVKNGDVEGIIINLKPLLAISGRVVIPASQEVKCESAYVPGPEQVLISARPEKKKVDNLFLDRQNDASAQLTGEFRINSLSIGNYRLRTFLPTEDWYIKTIERPGSLAPTGRQIKTTGNPAELVTLNNGESINGLTIGLAGGAGSVYGRVTTAPVDEQSSRRLYLVPSEKERADDTLRFAESSIATDGSFAFRNLAPGKYFLTFRMIKDPDVFRPLFWDAKERATLINERVSVGLAVEVKSCQSTKDLVIKLGPNGLTK